MIGSNSKHGRMLWMEIVCLLILLYASYLCVWIIILNSLMNILMLEKDNECCEILKTI